MKTKKELTEIEIQCLCGIKQRISLPEDFDLGKKQGRKEALNILLQKIYGHFIPREYVELIEEEIIEMMEK